MGSGLSSLPLQHPGRAAECSFATWQLTFFGAIECEPELVCYNLMETPMFSGAHTGNSEGDGGRDHCGSNTG